MDSALPSEKGPGLEVEGAWPSPLQIKSAMRASVVRIELSDIVVNAGQLLFMIHKL